MNATALKKQMRAAGYPSAARNLEQRIRDFGLPLECTQGIWVRQMVMSGQLVALRDGITLVTVTHDPQVARRADRVLVLRDGQIVRRISGTDVSTLDDLFAEPDPDTNSDHEPSPSIEVEAS